MGGKALNKFGVHTERKNTNEFLQIGYELKSRLFFDLDVFSQVVTCYHTKADHGDLDLLLRIHTNMNINYVDYIKKTFSPQAINANGGVYSFDYKDFQVDFIPIPASKWETAVVYFSYDPLGNIMGKTFHKFGLSYGWEGLFYKFRNFNGSNSQDILLTNDAKKIFDFGGYDYERYLFGFDTLEEIFRFCINSKYFDAEMFKMENLKSIDRKRNRKRGSYHLFLKFIEENGINTSYPFEKDKDNYLLMIDNAFPAAQLFHKLDELKQIDEINRSLAEKFNGNIVMEWFPELKGKELGAAMSKFKKAFGNEDNYKKYIQFNNINAIKLLFTDVYKYDRD